MRVCKVGIVIVTLLKSISLTVKTEMCNKYL